MLLAGKLPLVVIIGPTAVGKTGATIEIARTIGGEIVNADSRQIYRHMDIGTAKPTLEQQREAQHHLINIVNPDETLSVSQFQRLAYAAIQDIHRRGHIPLLVGGSGQYITAVIEGWSIPEVPPNETLRTELESFATKHGSVALHQRLQERDPAAARNIDHRNIRRVVRALEVCVETGTPISQLQKKNPPPYSMIHFGLTMDREALYERANQRFDSMIAEGFVAEVQNLLSIGYRRHLPSMSGLGYAELCAHLCDNLPLAEAIERSKFNTHDFIRRQYTWFRGHDPGILWHNMDSKTKTTMINQIRNWIKELT